MRDPDKHGGYLQPGTWVQLDKLRALVEPHTPATGDALWAAFSRDELERLREICREIVSTEKLSGTVKHFKRQLEKADRLLAIKDPT